MKEKLELVMGCLHTSSDKIEVAYNEGVVDGFDPKPFPQILYIGCGI